MPTENLSKTITLPAGGNLSGSQYCFVVIGSDGTVTTATAGADADGVLQNNPSAAGQAATVMIGEGITIIKTGGAFNVGALIASDSSGRAVAASSNTYYLGKALEASTGANQYVTILFRRRGVKAPN